MYKIDQIKTNMLKSFLKKSTILLRTPPVQEAASYPVEVGKTVLSLAILGLGFLVTTFSLALTHEVSLAQALGVI